MARGRGGHVLATVLFTDIVDSSRLARELGDRRWRILLDRHHVVVRRALKRWRGREIDDAGDGFFMLFEDQDDAIRCACAITDEVRTLGLEVRAGCHIGQAEIIGRKIGGVTVHAGARVMSLAGPSEVLVSRTLVDLLPASGFAFTDRGVHELKGIDGTWQLFAVSSVDGQPRPGPVDPEELRSIRETIEPVPLRQRRSSRAIAIAGGVAVVVAAVIVALDRPHPVEVRASSLVRIDPATNEVVADVPVSSPGGAQLAIVPPHEVWVLSQPEQVISVVDQDMERVSERVPLQSGQARSLLSGFGMAYGWGSVWVAPRRPSDHIIEFDPRSRQQERKLQMPGNTGRLATGGGVLWVPVAPPGGWQLATMDPETGHVEVLAETGPGGYNVGFGEGSAWVSDHFDSTVTKVDPDTGETETIDLGAIAQPSGIGFGYQSVWVSDALNGVVYRIDPATDEIVDTIHVAPLSEGFQSDVLDFDGSIWVTSPLAKTVIRIDPATDEILTRIQLPYAPQDLVAGYGSLWATVVDYPD